MPLNKITTCLWFDSQGEEAATFYTSIFKDSRIKQVQRYTESGKEFHGKEPGSAMVVAFELDGHPFVALNGGPNLEFNAAISFQIDCKDQEEVDYFWEKLGEGANPEKQRCGKFVLP
jgi:predicted 3-demethylubiquinone-9 3-methyltransferase (glyoxalase superfamily)